MTALNLSRGDRLNSVALTARLSYLSNVPATRLCSWTERLALVLQFGAAWLPSRPWYAPPLLDDVDLYRELENHAFPHLVALQKEAGKPAVLAVLVLAQVELGNRDGAFEAWATLRSFRKAEMAHAADLARNRKRLLIRDANRRRLNRSQEGTAKIIEEATKMMAAKHPRPDIVESLAQRTGLSASHIRRILQKK